MTVKELIELNANITDIYIEVRNYPENGQILDAYFIGPDAGVVPPYPFEWSKSTAKHGKAKYVRKNINAYDDGRDYFEIKADRLPAYYLNLNVYSWRHSEVYRSHHQRDDLSRSMEAIRITTYAPGAGQEPPKEKYDSKQDLDENGQLKGQLSFEDL